MHTVDVHSFEQEVLQASQSGLVLLDISAEWCGPCKMIAPILDKAEQAYPEVRFAKLEAEDENMKIAGQYGVRGFPTIVAIYHGEELDRFHGAKPWSFVQDFIHKNLAAL